MFACYISNLILWLTVVNGLVLQYKCNTAGTPSYGIAAPVSHIQLEDPGIMPHKLQQRAIISQEADLRKHDLNVSTD